MFVHAGEPTRWARRFGRPGPAVRWRRTRWGCGGCSGIRRSGWPPSTGCPVRPAPRQAATANVAATRGW